MMKQSDIILCHGELSKYLPDDIMLVNADIILSCPLEWDYAVAHILAANFFGSATKDNGEEIIYSFSEDNYEAYKKYLDEPAIWLGMIKPRQAVNQLIFKFEMIRVINDDNAVRFFVGDKDFKSFLDERKLFYYQTRSDKRGLYYVSDLQRLQNKGDSKNPPFINMEFR